MGRRRRLGAPTPQCLAAIGGRLPKWRQIALPAKANKFAKARQQNRLSFEFRVGVFEFLMFERSPKGHPRPQSLRQLRVNDVQSAVVRRSCEEIVRDVSRQFVYCDKLQRQKQQR